MDALRCVLVAVDGVDELPRPPSPAANDQGPPLAAHTRPDATACPVPSPPSTDASPASPDAPTWSTCPPATTSHPAPAHTSSTTTTTTTLPPSPLPPPPPSASLLEMFQCSDMSSPATIASWLRMMPLLRTYHGPLDVAVIGALASACPGLRNIQVRSGGGCGGG